MCDPLMVNAVVVNGETGYVFRPYFCKFFLALGRFLLLNPPVKYTRIFAINQNASPAFALQTAYPS
jgi:hypothetical protein